MAIKGAGITAGTFNLVRDSGKRLHVARMKRNQDGVTALCGQKPHGKAYQVPLVPMAYGPQIPVVACQGWPPGVCHKCKCQALDRFNVKLPD